jgi:hypothetical protein
MKDAKFPVWKWQVSLGRFCLWKKLPLERGHFGADLKKQIP